MASANNTIQHLHPQVNLSNRGGKSHRPKQSGRAHSVNMTAVSHQVQQQTTEQMQANLNLQMQAQSASLQAARSKLATQISNNNQQIQVQMQAALEPNRSKHTRQQYTTQYKSTNNSSCQKEGITAHQNRTIDTTGGRSKNFNQTQLNPQTLFGNLRQQMMSDINSPVDYSSNNNQAFNFSSILSPKEPIANQYQHSSYSYFKQQQMMQPFTGGQTNSHQHLSSQGSGANMNVRSQSQVSRNSASKPPRGLSDALLIESDECFEAAKNYLTDKKYKEAISGFTKSLNINPQNYDSLFYRAVSQLDFGQPQKAIEDLCQLIEVCVDYRKTMFIVLSIAYRRINDYTSALRTLSRALAKYPRYQEAYIARGQIYIFQKNFQKALSDFTSVINLGQDKTGNGLGYLGQGDSFKGIGNLDQSLQAYSKAIEFDEKSAPQGLMKRGLLYLQMKMNDRALEDFTKLTDLAESSEQGGTQLLKAYFQKAKALKKMNNLQDSVLYFEQVVRQSSLDTVLGSQALYEIAKIKIQQKDFYEAHHNLKRATHFKLKMKKLNNYRIFTEGVIFLMKRKTKTAIKMINTLVERLGKQDDQPGLAETDYIYQLIFVYRAYGHFVTEEYELCLKDYLKANQIKKLNLGGQYNMQLAQGLKFLQTKDFETAISFFTKAQQKMPQNRDPFLLRAVSIVRYALQRPIKPQTRIKMLKDAKRDLNQCIKEQKVKSQDYTVLYLRGLLNFALNYFYDAITDFELVIENSDEANANHYLARGRCYACLSMFKEAITDLSIAVNLNKDLLDAYLNRGKCAYLIGDTGLAFMDFQKIIVIEPKDPMVHIYAGNLLMTTGSYEDATKAFTNADNIQRSSLALYQRARCNVALNNMGEALKDLNKVIEIASSDKVAMADRECLNALKQASNKEGGQQLPHEKSVYEKANVALTKLINYEQNEHLSKITHESSITHHHSQLIPSAHRTKTDKIRVQRRRKEQDRLVKDGKMKRNDLRFRVEQHDEEDENEYDDVSDLDNEEISRLNHQLEAGSNATQLADYEDPELDRRDAEDLNYYKENIFNKEDYFLFRGILNLYAGAYDKAIQDLDQSSQIMHSNKQLVQKEQFPSTTELENKSAHSSQTDLSDVGLCSLNIHEYTFNQVVCLICMKNYTKALERLDYMINTVPKKYANQLWLIRAQTMHNIQAGADLVSKDMKRALKYDKENCMQFQEGKKNVFLTVFPQQQRLCSSFAFVKTPLANGTSAIYLRPSFSFPFIKPPNMIPCVDTAVIERAFITPKGQIPVQLKPEAPWVKKDSANGCIKFTDEIYLTDESDGKDTPDSEKENKAHNQRHDNRDKMFDEMAGSIPRSYSQEVYLKKNIFLQDENQQSYIDEEEEPRVEDFKAIRHQLREKK